MPDNTEEGHGVEVYKLSDGTTVSKYCMSRMINFDANLEAIWDIWDVATRLIRLEVTKDENGFVTDVIQIIPHIDDVVVMLALRNFEECQKIMKELPRAVPPEEQMEWRRFRLQEKIEGKCQHD